jgi:hypothetical protein
MVSLPFFVAHRDSFFVTRGNGKEFIAVDDDWCTLHSIANWNSGI